MEGESAEGESTEGESAEVGVELLEAPRKVAMALAALPGPKPLVRPRALEVDQKTRAGFGGGVMFLYEALLLILSKALQEPWYPRCGLNVKAWVTAGRNSVWLEGVAIEW